MACRIDTIGTLFEKILSTRILNEVSGRGVLRNKQCGLRPKRSNSLQLASSLKVSRNFNEKKSTCAVFLDVAKAFSTQLVDGLLYKPTAYNFPWFLVKTIF